MHTLKHHLLPSVAAAIVVALLWQATLIAPVPTKAAIVLPLVA